VAAASVMFGMDFLVNICTKSSKDDEDVEFLYPSKIGSSPLYPDIKCITYLVHPTYLIELKLYKMPKTMNTSMYKFDMHCRYINDSGLEDEDPVINCPCGGKTSESRVEIEIVDYPVQKDPDEAADGFVVKVGPNQTPVLHVSFELIE